MSRTDVTGPIEALEPFQLGTTKLRNRVVVPAHTTNFAVPGENLVTDRYVQYLATRARGGAGLIVTEGIRVHPTTLRVSGLAGYEAGFGAGMDRLAEAVHGEGAALFAQVLHSGRHVAHPQLHSVGASDIPWTAGAARPHALYPQELAEMLESYRDVSQRLAATDVDGLELHLGHGHLLQQFMSPLTNHRDDDYGGSFQGRLRFPLATVDTVVRSGLPVGLRISGDEFAPGGLGIDQMLEILDVLVAEFPITYIHVSHSVYDGGLSMATQMADMSHDPAPFRELPAAVKAAFPQVPVVAVCRIDTLDAASEIIRSGQADLVGMARAHIADPDLVRKTEAGRVAQIRSCLYCNQGCAGHIEKGLPITCVVNPTVGLETSWPMPAGAGDARQTVAVVGGGPAGMEAALAAEANGHRVQLHERGLSLGGAVVHAARLAGRSRFGLLARELIDAVHRSDVQVHLGSEMPARALATAGFDHIVVATGAVDPAIAIDGCGRVLSPVEAMDANDAGTLGDPVTIVDEDGGWAASGLAAELARTGRSVHLVVPGAHLAWNVTMYSRPTIIQGLGDGKVGVHLLRTPLSCVAGELVLADTLTGETSTLTGIAEVVWAGSRRAEDGLARDLLAGVYAGQVHVVGDAYAPRTALEAVREGRLTGATLGSTPAEGAPPHRPGLAATRGAGG